MSLTARQQELLAEVASAQPAAASAVNANLAMRGIDFSSVEATSAALRRLAARGLVESERWAVDSRVYLYSATKAGRGALDAAGLAALAA